jgi:radical SAM superfamily enzyme YgiQ (UPF0313 family)
MAVNAKYVHSNLPLRYLRQRFSEPSQFSFFEYTINQQVDAAYAELLVADLDVLLISLYIWNGQWVQSLMSSLKQVRPDLKVFIGGPEAESQENFKDTFPWADVLIVGELDALVTEEQFNRLLKAKEGTYDLGQGQMDTIPFAYTDEELKTKNMFYYESERGCPFLCSFCMASEQKSGRQKDLKLVFEDLDRFMDHCVSQVKFVDRTFNASPERAIAILNFILSRQTSHSNFHFELAPHLITEQFLQVVDAAPEGLFQFELGLQSFNPHTLKAIHRHPDQGASVKGIKSLLHNPKAHVHVDLIAGLPHETLESFGEGINQLMALKPHMLQLGFLKLMKGTALYRERETYHYQTRHFAPYEVLASSTMSPKEFILLKGVEDIVETYHNSHRFDHSLNYLLGFYDKDAFRFYREFVAFRQAGYMLLAHSSAKDYEDLLAFARQLSMDLLIFDNLLKLDYLTHFSSPTSFYTPEPLRLGDDAHHNLRDFENQQFLLEEGLASPMPVKEILKRGQIATFTMDLDAFIQQGIVIPNEQIYFIMKHKNSKHAVPRYAYLKV